MWPPILSIIEQHRTFVITAHVNPDCDALGSELALAEFLWSLGKKVTIINSDLVPDPYRFLDPQRNIKKYSPTKHAATIKHAEVIIVVDASGGWKRIGRPGDVFAQCEAIKVCIDHHPDSTDFVDVTAIDTNAAATAELIYELIQAAQGVISATIAEALYAGIITDTGNFRFPKTSARTHRIAADLLLAGVDPLVLYRQIYEQYPLGRVRLKGHVIDSIQTTAHGQLAYYGLELETLKAYKVKTADLDGFASLGQEIRGVQVVVFCLQSSKSKVKISLRSDGSVPVNQLAAAYGGGGHPSAAGATVSGNLADVLPEVVEKATALLTIREA
jgi:phosphoesterase RecJ-like protein